MESLREKCLTLELRTLVAEDEALFLKAIETFKNEPMDFAFDLRENEPFVDYLARLESWGLGTGLPEHFVPNTFFVGMVNGQLVGRLSLRHDLRDWNREVHGHIGYCVLPQYRRRGFASAMLKQVLPICRQMGIDKTLLTCPPENEASRKTIESCGGVFERMSCQQEGKPLMRYWINLDS